MELDPMSSPSNRPCVQTVFFSQEREQAVSIGPFIT
jgi:hypothetical protein